MVVPNPFTPKSGLEPKEFIGRELEKKQFERILADLITSHKQNHFIILGGWGIGKTSLLKEFKKIAQEKGVLGSLISLRPFKESDDSIEVTQSLVGEIAFNLPINTNKLKGFISGLNSFGVQVMGTGIQFSKETKRSDPQLFLSSSLLNLWNDVKKDTKAIVVLLDDAQNLSSKSEILTILKNVLSNEKIIGGTNYLFVLSCTPEDWTGFMQRYDPVGRYFTPRLVLKKLNKEETFEVVKKSLEGTGVAIPSSVLTNIYEITLGHPYELQVLCSYLYDSQIEGKITDMSLPTSLRETLKTLGEEVFEEMYKEASGKERNVLYLIAKNDKPTSWKLISEQAKKHFKVSTGPLSPMLSRLLEKKLVEKPDKATYFISDPLFRLYVTNVKGYDGEGNHIKS